MPIACWLDFKICDRSSIQSCKIGLTNNGYAALQLANQLVIAYPDRLLVRF